jgi:hypothetical protein
MPKKALLAPDVVEIVPKEPVLVPETTRLFRLTPTEENLAQAHRQIAIVAADEEVQARSLAAAHDPFGRDWSNERDYVCDILKSEDRHVVGDVVFKSAPIKLAMK